MDENAFLIALADSPRTHFGKVEFQQQPEQQRVFSAIWGLEGLVNMDGFAGCFSWAGEGHNFAATALRRIGAERCAELVSRALRIVSPGALPDDQASRAQLVAALEEPALTALDALDEEAQCHLDDRPRGTASQALAAAGPARARLSDVACPAAGFSLTRTVRRASPRSG